MILHWNFASRFMAVCVSATLLAGCATTALSPGKSVLDVQAARDAQALNVSNQQQPAAFPSHPSGFGWATQTLQAVGQGAATEGMPTAQREVAARNSATLHAKANLKEKVRALPVGTDQTVGSIMNTYITLRLAVEQEIAAAKVTGLRPLPNGQTEVQVELPMQNTATLLAQHHITPDEALPEPGEKPAGVPDII
jgi:hypothetical protein